MSVDHKTKLARITLERKNVDACRQSARDLTDELATAKKRLVVAYDRLLNAIDDTPQGELFQPDPEKP